MHVFFGQYLLLLSLIFILTFIEHEIICIPGFSVFFFSFPDSKILAGHWRAAGGQVGGPTAAAASGPPTIWQVFFWRAAGGCRPFPDNIPPAPSWRPAHSFCRAIVGPLASRP